MGIIFEWDSYKAKSNALKHGITFEEATTVFADIRSLTIHDVVHSESEKRYITLGLSTYNHLLVIVYTYRKEKLRIISARMASKKEKKQYYEN